MIILLEIHEQTTSPEKLERAQYLMALNLAQYQFPTWVFKGWKLKQFWHNIKSDLIPSNWALMSSSRGGCTSLCLQERTGSWNLTRHLVRIVTWCLIFSVTSLWISKYSRKWDSTYACGLAMAKSQEAVGGTDMVRWEFWSSWGLSD